MACCWVSEWNDEELVLLGGEIGRATRPDCLLDGAAIPDVRRSAVPEWRRVDDESGRLTGSSSTGRETFDRRDAGREKEVRGLWCRVVRRGVTKLELARVSVISWLTSSWFELGEEKRLGVGLVVDEDGLCGI